MSLYLLLESQLGDLTLPLLVMAASAFVLILECTIRLVFHAATQDIQKRALRLYEHSCKESCEEREQEVERYLGRAMARLTTRLRILQLIGALAPTTGLLGTILGLITAFDAIAGSPTGVNPALVADGLGIAMKTTAAGLIIAIPAVFFAHLLGMWAEALTTHAADSVNMRIKAQPKSQYRSSGIEHPA